MIIANIKSFSHFKSIETLVDGVIMTSAYSISSNNALNAEEMKEIISYANALNKLAIIDISSLATNKEIEMLDKFIDEFTGLNVAFQYTDIGVYNVLKKKGLESKGVYDPKTLITNSFDMNLYLERGIMAIGLSNEIPARDIEKINSKKIGATWLKVFGYHQMFYSKRHLLSVYNKYKGRCAEVDRENTFIREETRGESYHIDENAHGTVIYRSYPISYMKVLDCVKDVDYLVFNSDFMSEDDFKYALEIYNEALSGKMDLDIANLKLKERFDIEDGFIYNDTVYVKEEASR